MTAAHLPATAPHSDGRFGRGRVRRERIYQFVLEYKAAHDGNSPTVREIASGCGLKSLSSVFGHLHNLCKLGQIQIDDTGSRNIKVVGGRWVGPESEGTP